MSKFIKNDKSTLRHYTEPFNFDAIFHRIRILLHQSEPNRNPEKPDRTNLFRGSRFFRIPVTDKHYSELIGYISFHAVWNQIIELEKVLIKQHPNLPSVCCYWWSEGLTSWRFPLTGLAINNVSGDFLYPILWKYFLVRSELTIESGFVFQVWWRIC